MKVILVNGSPHANGCTYTALNEIAGALKNNGIESEIFYLGTKAISGCISCQACKITHKCAINDIVNEFADLLENADGLIFGSPVHYAAATGMITSFMNRLFYAYGKLLKGKPAAAIVSCRRAGATAALDQLNKYFLINQMPIVSSQYWNMVHGSTPADVIKDEEGMKTMRVLGNNMSWLLKCLAVGKQAGITMPHAEPRKRTDFIKL